MVLARDVTKISSSRVNTSTTSRKGIKLGGVGDSAYESGGDARCLT